VASPQHVETAADHSPSVCITSCAPGGTLVAVCRTAVFVRFCLTLSVRNITPPIFQVLRRCTLPSLSVRNITPPIFQVLRRCTLPSYPYTVINLLVSSLSPFPRVPPFPMPLSSKNDAGAHGGTTMDFVERTICSLEEALNQTTNHPFLLYDLSQAKVSYTYRTESCYSIFKPFFRFGDDCWESGGRVFSLYARDDAECTIDL